jgi:CheY-like chemotaxis protein
MGPVRIGSHARGPLTHSSPDTGGATAGSPPPVGLLRVMVVEDHLDVGEILEKCLTEWGYASRVCTSGNEALALAPYYQPQVVLIDIGLPDMDGWEFARRLRQQQPTNTPILVAITAHGEQQDFQRSQSVGISYHLVKPSFQPQLRQILDRLARDK